MYIYGTLQGAGLDDRAHGRHARTRREDVDLLAADMGSTLNGVSAKVTNFDRVGKKVRKIDRCVDRF